MKNLIIRLLKLIIITSICIEYVDARDINKTIIATKHNKNLTLGQIAEIQPGLGSIMMEFGHRFYVAYYAAKAGNWELADYEIHELIEAQEVAETTRPKYKKQLKSFEDNYLSKLNNTIKEESWDKFKKQYTQTTVACNQCHKSNGHPYIKYILPKNPPKYLNMK